MKNNLLKGVIAIVILLLVAFATYNFNSSDKKNSFNESKVKTQVAEILNNDILRQGVKAEVNNVKIEFGFYKANVTLNGSQKEDFYFTKDFKKFIPQIIEIEKIREEKKKAEESKKLVKSNKPKVELFVMSYCPYGTMMEKGYLPAVKKLGDKIDTEIKFVSYVMHDKKEIDENVKQYCIEKNENNKFNDYLTCFLGAGKSDECLDKTKINKTALSKCIVDTDKKFEITKNYNDKSGWLNGRYPQFNIHKELNTKYNVQGSPTLVINGQKIENAGRDADSVFQAICNRFKNKPAVCNEKLSTKSPAPGFGYGKDGSSTPTASCGA